MADLVYPPVIRLVRAFWKYLDLQFTFYGQSHIPSKGPAILAMNHVSYLDFALAGTALLPTSRLVRFMAKKEIFDHPIAGPLMRGMKHISVDRNNGAPSFLAALKALDKAEIVGIFPEATISQSFELKEMKSGVIRLAMESGAPILPMVIWGSQRIWSKKLPKNLSRNSIPIFIAIGPLRYIEKGSNIDVELAALKEAMAQLLNQVQSDYPSPHKGARWAPARLGGSAPTLAELEDLRNKQRES
jgi:1-acyl-sn-glycerol-3-phosphate acyltransferase